MEGVSLTLPWCRTTVCCRGFLEPVIQRLCQVQGWVVQGDGVAGVATIERCLIPEARPMGGRDYVPVQRGKGEYAIPFRTGHVLVKTDLPDVIAVLSVPDQSVELTLLQMAIERVLASRGILTVHAAAVEMAGHRWLVLGESGSGKSTFCAAVLAAGGRVVSDDSLWVQLVEDRLVIRSARSSLGFREGALALLGSELRDRLVETVAWDGRRWILDRQKGQTEVDLGELERVVVLGPRQPGITDFAFQSLSSAETYAYLLSSVASLYQGQAFGMGRDGLAEVMGRVASIQGLRLTLGPRLVSHPQAVLADIERQVY